MASAKSPISSVLKALIGVFLLYTTGLLIPPSAQAQVAVTVSGNTAKAVVGLPGLAYTEMNLSFESPTNLRPDTLGISARLISVADLIGRLPEPGFLALPLTFPVMISVKPPANKGLSFVNAVTVEIHTHALLFSLDNTFRMYKAPAAGSFHDMTQSVASGSVRAAGRTGGFSDFVILIDSIPNPDKAEDQYAYLDLRTNNSAISGAARNKLKADLAASRSAFNSGNLSLARTYLDTFIADVRRYGGKGVPNKWRAKGDLDNIAGDLIGAAAALKYTIARI